MRPSEPSGWEAEQDVLLAKSRSFVLGYFTLRQSAEFPCGTAIVHDKLLQLRPVREQRTMFSKSRLWRRSRRWLTSRLDPTSYFLLRHPDRCLDFRQLARGLREVVPHPRLYFMIVLPGSLHIVHLACQFVPADVRLVLILTGVDAWEEAWARAHLKPAWILKVRFSYRHHEVLNLLLREIPQPFGITDYDCFVFRPEYLRAIEAIDPRTSAQVFFANHNDILDIWVPETFLLGLNQPVLAELMSRYRVGTNQIHWDDLSTAAQERLATLGIGPNHARRPISQRLTHCGCC